MNNFWERIGRLWCEAMHSHTMWPIHGKYRCGDCLREYAVPFEQTPRPLRNTRSLPVVSTPQRQQARAA